MVPDQERPNGWKILELGGIPVYLEPSFLLFMGLIFLMNMGSDGIDVPAVGIFIVAIFISLVVHEFGHALTAKLSGCDRIIIALRMFGGYATHTPTTRGKSLLIVLMGPAFGFALFGIALLLSIFLQAPPASVEHFLSTLIFINLFWSVFNLIPIYPMDGGQALYHTLTFWKYDETALVMTAKVSMVASVITGYFAYQFGFLFMGLFCIQFFVSNLQIVQAYSGDGGNRWR